MNSSFELVIDLLRKRNQTVGLAESCTGGLMSAAFCAIPGVSDVFLGSIVSYANQAKIDLLHVSQATLQNEGAVSAKVAQEMAVGARQRLRSHWSISITGIAGPTGGAAQKPIGTVWFGAAGPNIEMTEKVVFSGSRTEIQRQAVDYAVKLLLNLLNK